MARAVLASVWYSAKVRAPVNELQGAYGCSSPKELKGERVGTDELPQMTAAREVGTGSRPFSTGNGKEGGSERRRDLIIVLISYFSAIVEQLLYLFHGWQIQLLETYLLYRKQGWGFSPLKCSKIKLRFVLDMAEADLWNSSLCVLSSPELSAQHTLLGRCQSCSSPSHPRSSCHSRV